MLLPNRINAKMQFMLCRPQFSSHETRTIDLNPSHHRSHSMLFAKAPLTLSSHRPTATSKATTLHTQSHSHPIFPNRFHGFPLLLLLRPSHPIPLTTSHPPSPVPQSSCLLLPSIIPRTSSLPQNSRSVLKIRFWPIGTAKPRAFLWTSQATLRRMFLSVERRSE